MLSSKYGDQYRRELSDSLKGDIEEMRKLNDANRANTSLFIRYLDRISRYLDQSNFLVQILTLPTRYNIWLARHIFTYTSNILGRLWRFIKE